MRRYAVLWRKRSQGTSSEKGNRWVERIVSLRQTCRLQGKSSFHVLVDAMNASFKDVSLLLFKVSLILLKRKLLLNS